MRGFIRMIAAISRETARAVLQKKCDRDEQESEKTKLRFVPETAS